jgi:homospermidine synthase
MPRYIVQRAFREGFHIPVDRDDAELCRGWSSTAPGGRRKLAPCQKATGLQVTSAVLAGTVWAVENADAEIVEADEIDCARCLQVQRPYLDPVEGHFTTWTPLTGRSPLLPQDIDPDDPWQFRNVHVH